MQFLIKMRLFGIFKHLVTNLLGQGIGDWKSNKPIPTIFKLGCDFCPFAVGGNTRVTSTGKLIDVIFVTAFNIANRIKIFSVR